MRTKKAIDRAIETAKKYVKCSRHFLYCNGDCESCEFRARMGDVARAVEVLIEVAERKSE